MKKILLQTMPHSGTHTMIYLFHILGGIEVVWHHWEKNCLEDIEIAKNMDWKDFVFVRTYRNPVDTLDSYKTRLPDPQTGALYFMDCCEVFTEHNLDFPVPIGIEIDGTNADKTRHALEVFRRCEVEPSEAALDYMKSWKRIASQHDDDKPERALKLAIHKGRVQIWHTK